MKIQIKNRQSKIKVDRCRLRKIISSLLRELHVSDKEISLMLVDDPTIRKLNKDYLNRDKPTNVLSFSMQEGDHGNIHPEILGDVVVSLETAQREALQGHLTTEQAIVFLIIHGLLHLLGYQHENTTRYQTQKMKKKERELFNRIYCFDISLTT